MIWILWNENSKYWTWLMNWLCLLSAFRVKLWTGVISSLASVRSAHSAVIKRGSSEAPLYLCICLCIDSPPSPSSPHVSVCATSKIGVMCGDEPGARWTVHPVMVSEHWHLRELHCLLWSGLTSHTNTHTQHTPHSSSVCVHHRDPHCRPVSVSSAD